MTKASRGKAEGVWPFANAEINENENGRLVLDWTVEEMVARFVLNKINPLKKFKLTELINSNFNNIF